MQNLALPIGVYETQPFSMAQKKEWLQDIQFLPQEVEIAIENMDAAELDTPYRPNGWTAKQVVHHIADSHLNAYTRFKLAVTEDCPTIKTYDQDAWSLLPDVANVPINISVTLLYALHTRWHNFLQNCTDAHFDKLVFHPGLQKKVSLWYLLGLYAWHGKHHVQHILMVKKKYHKNYNSND
jgi:DinB superfamily